ncbi:hypothetical protein AVEN_237493-1 [Araneus ventricosus]|uniref:Uncharacterized protein n=1 Tax=Araneus ventricosus TaxID=182803 RepID=A0A4Y2F916_ARAVE|nr:hypothetical protein AVEN_237493-1 [Araneus ventricosus]
MILASAKGQGSPSGKSTALGTGEIQIRKSIPPKLLRVWNLSHAKSYKAIKGTPARIAHKPGDGRVLPAQTSSSDLGSKLQVVSPNIPHIASKCYVNVIKLN